MLKFIISWFRSFFVQSHIQPNTNQNDPIDNDAINDDENNQMGYEILHHNQSDMNSSTSDHSQNDTLKNATDINISDLKNKIYTYKLNEQHRDINKNTEHYHKNIDYLFKHLDEKWGGSSSTQEQKNKLFIELDRLLSLIPNMAATINFLNYIENKRPDIAKQNKLCYLSDILINNNNLVASDIYDQLQEKNHNTRSTFKNECILINNEIIKNHPNTDLQCVKSNDGEFLTDNHIKFLTDDQLLDYHKKLSEFPESKLEYYDKKINLMLELLDLSTQSDAKNNLRTMLNKKFNVQLYYDTRSTSPTIINSANMTESINSHKEILKEYKKNQTTYNTDIRNYLQEMLETVPFKEEQKIELTSMVNQINSLSTDQLPKHFECFMAKIDDYWNAFMINPISPRIDMFYDGSNQNSIAEDTQLRSESEKEKITKLSLKEKIYYYNQRNAQIQSQTIEMETYHQGIIQIQKIQTELNAKYKILNPHTNQNDHIDIFANKHIKDPQSNKIFLSPWVTSLLPPILEGLSALWLDKYNYNKAFEAIRSACETFDAQQAFMETKNKHSLLSSIAVTVYDSLIDGINVFNKNHNQEAEDNNQQAAEDQPFDQEKEDDCLLQFASDTIPSYQQTIKDLFADKLTKIAETVNSKLPELQSAFKKYSLEILRNDKSQLHLKILRSYESQSPIFHRDQSQSHLKILRNDKSLLPSKYFDDLQNDSNLSLLKILYSYIKLEHLHLKHLHPTISDLFDSKSYNVENLIEIITGKSSIPTCSNFNEFQFCIIQKIAQICMNETVFSSSKLSWRVIFSKNTTLHSVDTTKLIQLDGAKYQDQLINKIKKYLPSDDLLSTLQAAHHMFKLKLEHFKDGLKKKYHHQQRISYTNSLIEGRI